MFSKACNSNRESIYGLMCKTPFGNNQIAFSNGTAFMIAPGICATAAHTLHVDGDKTKPIHNIIQVIRTPDIGHQMSLANLICEDVDRDLALIEIINPTNVTILNLCRNKIANGTNCGSLGFPLAKVLVVNSQIAFNLVERFQGAYISAFQTHSSPTRSLDFYETDSLMYGGSSGCPGFLIDGNIFGMHVSTIMDTDANNVSTRLAISSWVPSLDIINYANANNITQINVL